MAVFVPKSMIWATFLIRLFACVINKVVSRLSRLLKFVPRYFVYLWHEGYKRKKPLCR